MKHQRSVKGQQITRSDSYETHLVWAAKAFYAGAQPVPEGMAIMPNEPTLEMIDATGATMPDMREMVVADYKAMLAAAKETK